MISLVPKSSIKSQPPPVSIFVATTKRSSADIVRRSSRKCTPVIEHPVIAMLNKSAFIESQPPPAPYSVATPSQTRTNTPRQSIKRNRSVSAPIDQVSKESTPKQSVKKNKSISAPTDHTAKQPIKKRKLTSVQTTTDGVRRSSRKPTPVTEHPVIAMLNRSAMIKTVTINTSTSGMEDNEITLDVTIEEVNPEMGRQNAENTPSTGRRLTGGRRLTMVDTSPSRKMRAGRKTDSQ